MNLRCVSKACVNNIEPDKIPTQSKNVASVEAVNMGITYAEEWCGHQKQRFLLRV